MGFLPDIGSSLPEVILRTAVVYLFLVVVLRISGKREVGQRLLVRDGKLLEKAMREEGVDAEEVRRAVRRQGLARVDDVRIAVLETDGTISVIPRDA